MADRSSGPTDAKAAKPPEASACLPATAKLVLPAIAVPTIVCFASGNDVALTSPCLLVVLAIAALCIAILSRAATTHKREMDGLTRSRTLAAATELSLEDSAMGGQHSRYWVTGMLRGVPLRIESDCSDRLTVVERLRLDMQGATLPMRLHEASAVQSIGKALHVVRDARTGDADFDAAWIVDADPELARAVFTDAIRSRVTAVRGQTPFKVFTEDGALVLETHTPAATAGPAPTTLAAQLELALTIREALLAHLGELKAPAVGQGAFRSTGLRVAAPESRADEVLPVESAAGDARRNQGH